MSAVIFSRKPKNWTVAFESSAGAWYPVADFESLQDAMDCVHYLNGGSSAEQMKNFTEAVEGIAGELSLLRFSVETTRDRNGHQ